MTTATTDTVATRIDLFKQAAAYAVEVLADIRPTDLDRATPCQDWDVRAVVLHLADVADAVIDLTVSGKLLMPTPRPSTTDEPIAVTNERIVALSTVLTTPQETVAAELLMGATQAAANELVAHAWDITTAIGADRPIPTDMAAALLALIDGALDDAARGDNFRPAVHLAATASPSDRFIAYLGRQPH